MLFSVLRLHFKSYKSNSTILFNCVNGVLSTVSIISIEVSELISRIGVS